MLPLKRLETGSSKRGIQTLAGLLTGLYQGSSMKQWGTHPNYTVAAVQAGIPCNATTMHFGRDHLSINSLGEVTR